MSTTRAIARLRDAFSANCAVDVPLSSLCSWRIGGPADLLFRPENEDELTAALRCLQEEEAAWWLVGAGSNLLFPDAGLRGVVLRLGGDFAAIDQDSTRVRAGGAASAGALCRMVAQQGLAGLEYAAGIPGTVGGMVRMNAGAHGSETADFLVRVRLMDHDGRTSWVDAADLKMGYRSCAGLAGRIILAAEWNLIQDTPDVVRERTKEMLQRRRETQPLRESSCGSVFKRPVGDFPGRLIEAAGLKGARVGAAAVSELHANFFINTGGATAIEMEALVELVRVTVKERFGVELEEEFQRVR